MLGSCAKAVPCGRAWRDRDRTAVMGAENFHVYPCLASDVRIAYQTIIVVCEVRWEKVGRSYLNMASSSGR